MVTLVRPLPSWPELTAAQAGGRSPTRQRRGAHREFGPEDRRYHPASLAALLSTVLMLWGLSRPALWLDESATVLAVQRPWREFWALWHGAEAPLMPYYLLVRLSDALLLRVLPAAGRHPELLYRWPSALAAVLTGWALVRWLAGFCSPRLALASAAMLLLSCGFSRYGQEARPYALVVLAAVLATIAWARLVQQPSGSPGRRRGARYAICIGVLCALHTLAAVLVLAHAVAALWTSPRLQRRRALRRTLGAAAAGLLAASPLIVASARHGEGPRAHLPITAGNLLSALVGLFDHGQHPMLRIGPILLLAVIGIARVRSPRDAFIARLACAWALVPPAALLPVIALRPNLLYGRYLLFTVPGWAVLAGLGLLTLLELARAGVAGLRRPAAPLTTAAALAAALALGTGALAAVALGTGAQLQGLAAVRAAGGHGEDIRPVLAIADQPRYAQLPIVVSYGRAAIELASYDRADERRLVGVGVQHREPTIWPLERSAEDRERLLLQRPALILLLRSAGWSECALGAKPAGAATITRCMPAELQRLGYRVSRIEPGGFGWSFSILQRRP